MDSSVTSVIQQHPSAVEMYLRHGWKLTPIPYGSKGPTMANWNQPGSWLTDVSVLPRQFNIGLLHAFSGTCAIDLDDIPVATDLFAQAGIDLDQLLSDSSAVTIESGNANHGKLLYAMPFGLTLPSKRLLGPKGNVALELRCGTSAGTTVQDVIPPSVHPVTGQQYRWGGKGRWDRLSTIPMPLLDFWMAQLSVQEPQRTSVTSAEWGDVVDALDQIPPSVGREEWLNVGMALHHTGMSLNRLSEAFDLFLNWSAGDPESPPTNYQGQRDIEVTWRSFKGNTDNPVTAGTLFSIAADHGYRPKPVDASSLFHPTAKPVDVLAGMRPPPPELDLSVIPGVLGTRAAEISESVGCDPIVPLFAGLGAVCGAVDARMRLKLADGYEVPPILWLNTIGSPSDRKTPGSKPMMGVLRDIEREDIPDFKRRHREWKVLNEHHKDTFEAYMTQQKDMLMGMCENTVDIVLPDLPPEPKPLLLTVQDITSQKLLHHGAAQPRGLLCYLDEMKGWLDHLTSKQSFENRSTWIGGYEGGTSRMDRIGSGEIVADPFSVSVYGNVQPTVWRSNIEALASDGFASRFIPGVLRPEYLKLGQPVPDELTSKGAYEGMIRSIFTLPVQTYTLSPEAYEMFREQQQWVITRTHEDLKIDVGDKYGFAFGKADGTVGRLTLVFHLMTNPHSPMVSADTMRRSIAFFRGYVVPALQYAYGEVGGQTAASMDTWLASHILYIADQATVSMRDLKRSAKRRLEKIRPEYHEGAILDAMLPLEACHWVVMVEENRRSSIYRWAINPELRNQFSDYRKQVIMIKQKRRDEMDRGFYAKTGEKPPRTLVPGYDPAWD